MEKKSGFETETKERQKQKKKNLDTDEEKLFAVKEERKEEGRRETGNNT